ncbi:E3 ubiquitin-protein ligase RNF13-like protein [Dinothrombium tinctorium]|uniref:RING-type E3 ubiquitin transferase n=1 Tax=Dinothrombium tinctorium TaxID=1965070 RepID=A0A3S3PPJ8_9ACAR|nr:E3 ubiquitin-protein ligase RNF13-like protein [Dinothrombium tinctorium]
MFTKLHSASFGYMCTFTPFVIVTCFVALCKANIEVRKMDNTTVAIFWDQDLLASSPVPNDGIAGRLLVADPIEACEPIKKAPNDNSTLKWIVLIKRLPCTFQRKLQNAKDAGFSAAIFYPMEPNLERRGPTVYFQSSENGDDSIPGVLVSNEDAYIFQRDYVYESGNQYYLIITPEMPYNFTGYLIPFAVVIGICLLIMISFMILQFIKCIRDQRRSRRHRLSKKHLKKIPTTKYKKGDQYDTCAICLEEYVEGEKLRVLPCHHGIEKFYLKLTLLVYHMKCIDPWLTKNRKVCPVCKGKVILPGMSEESNSESETETAERTAASERTPLLVNALSSDNNRRASRNRRENRRHRNTQTNIMFPSVSAIQSMINSDIFHESSNAGASNRIREVQVDITPTSLAPSVRSVNCDSESDAAIGGHLSNDETHNIERGETSRETRASRQVATSSNSGVIV